MGLAEEADKAGGVADRVFWPGNRRQVVENKLYKRNTIVISLVFYNIRQFETNEIFRVGPIIMLRIGAVSPEKFARFRLLNWG
jgi:hypothetical protein